MWDVIAEMEHTRLRGNADQAQRLERITGHQVMSSVGLGIRQSGLMVRSGNTALQRIDRDTIEHVMEAQRHRKAGTSLRTLMEHGFSSSLATPLIKQNYTLFPDSTSV
jgi:molybdate-binding protein